MYSIGDIIQIDYEKDGTYNHSTIVTGFQQNISGSGNSFTPKVTSRSGADSGLSRWYNNDTSIVDAGYVYPPTPSPPTKRAGQSRPASSICNPCGNTRF